MTDKHATRDEAARQYLAHRFYLNQISLKTVQIPTHYSGVEFKSVENLESICNVNASACQ